MTTTPAARPPTPATAACPIDRCVCTGQTFADLRERAERERLSTETLIETTRAGRCCGLCAPYITVMMRTGRTAFPVFRPGMPADQMEAAVRAMDGPPPA